MNKLQVENFSVIDCWFFFQLYRKLTSYDSSVVYLPALNAI